MTTSPPPTAYAPRVGDLLASLDTPSMVVDLDVMEANIAQLMGALLPRGVRVRPHLKTTKCAALARRLVAAGAVGGCVAKLSEAEALTARGFTDLLITCEVIGAPKVRRLVALVRRHPGCLRIVVDSVEGAEAIDAALAAEAEAMPPLDVLIDLDVGLHRTGVAAGEPALALAARVAALPRLRLIGVQGYEGHLQHVTSRAERRAACLEAMRTLTETATALRAAGHAVSVVTTGGTGTAEFCAAVPGVTEVQPGSFIFMDTDYAAALRDPGADDDENRTVLPPYRHALAIRATVLSRQGPRAVTIDAGLKSLTTDSGLAACADPRYRYGVLGDEHGSLTWDDDDGTPPLRVGDVVDMLPSHIDPTINLHDRYYAHRRGVLEEIWTVDARGMVQ